MFPKVTEFLRTLSAGTQPGFSVRTARALRGEETTTGFSCLLWVGQKSDARGGHQTWREAVGSQEYFFKKRKR